jgi:hypothetical protein
MKKMNAEGVAMARDGETLCYSFNDLCRVSCKPKNNNKPEKLDVQDVRMAKLTKLVYEKI